MEKFVNLAPESVRLHGSQGQPITAEVTIKPLVKYPFKIVGVKLPPNPKVSCKVTPKEGPMGMVYQLEIENIFQGAGHYYETVILKTDSAIRPEINILVYGMIDAAKLKKG